MEYQPFVLDYYYSARGDKDANKAFITSLLTQDMPYHGQFAHRSKRVAQ